MLENVLEQSTQNLKEKQHKLDKK